jgi:hypothetical protein
MAAIVHLVKGQASPLTPAVMERQLGAGDRVTVVLLEDAEAPPRPEGVTVHRVPEELTYSQLVDLIFEADQVIAW